MWTINKRSVFYYNLYGQNDGKDEAYETNFSRKAPSDGTIISAWEKCAFCATSKDIVGQTRAAAVW